MLVTTVLVTRQNGYCYNSHWKEMPTLGILAFGFGKKNLSYHNRTNYNDRNSNLKRGCISYLKICGFVSTGVYFLVSLALDKMPRNRLVLLGCSIVIKLLVDFRCVIGKWSAEGTKTCTR